jgi:heparosan-N-sulfate-glucuronate 5-epimerase
MTKLKKLLLQIFTSFFGAIIVLHFFGNGIEESIRMFYRDNLCNCDTLRHKEFYDSLGVPYINYYSINGIHIGKQRNPTTISFAANNYFNKINFENNKGKFKNCIDFFQHSFTRIDSSLFLEYKFYWVYNTQPPWRSAMAQGLAIKTFTQAFQIYNDSIYLQIADSLLNSFLIEVNSGGITYIDSNENWWYEEYASKNSTKPRVLNGMMYALHGIFYNYEHTNNEFAYKLFKKGINSLKSNLWKYENGKEHSFYDIHQKISTEYYHQIHVDFLKEFYKLTNENIFLIYYNKWSSIKSECYLSKLFSKPNKSSVFVFFTIFVGFFLIVFFLKKAIK